MKEEFVNELVNRIEHLREDLRIAHIRRNNYQNMVASADEEITYLEAVITSFEGTKNYYGGKSFQ